MGEEGDRELKVPDTTTIGSYPVFPPPEDIEYERKMRDHGISDEIVDPYLWSIDETVRDFASSGIEMISTGQTRGDLYEIFLDPRFVKGIGWKGAEAFVTERLNRIGNLRLADVRYAKSIIPDHIRIKEPITDAYTLARFAKITTGSYRDVRELAEDINRQVVIPEIEDLQNDGSASMVQLDSPNLAAESSPPDFVGRLYEDIAAVAKIPVVLHACGDTTRVFRMLSGMKVDTLSLDFYHYPRLLEEASKKNYDQTIGFGATDSQTPSVERVEEVASLISEGRKRLGDDRIEFVHPHCGQRSLHRETAFQKNANLTMARDDVYFGEAEEAKHYRLEKREYDPKGYFLVTIRSESREIVVTFYSYDHKAVRRYRSREAERILQALNDEADRLGISRRHLSYLTLELGRAEASLGSPALTYRQRMIE